MRRGLLVTPIVLLLLLVLLLRRLLLGRRLLLQLLLLRVLLHLLLGVHVRRLRLLLFKLGVSAAELEEDVRGEVLEAVLG